MVEPTAHNRLVEGSNPSLATTSHSLKGITMTIDTGTVHVYGPINGMGEEDSEGSYLKLSITTTHDETKSAVKITKAQAEEIARDLIFMSQDVKD